MRKRSIAEENDGEGGKEQKWKGYEMAKAEGWERKFRWCWDVKQNGSVRL